MTSLYLLKLLDVVCLVIELAMPKEFRVLSIDQKQVIIDLVRKGVSQSEVAELFNVNRCTVYRIVRRFETTNNLENMPKSGRPNLLSDRDERRSLLRAIKHDRSTPLAEVTAKFNQHWNRAVSKQTAKRYIDILEDNLWPVIARHFPENNLSYKTTMLQFTEPVLSHNIG